MQAGISAQSGRQIIYGKEVPESSLPQNPTVSKRQSWDLNPSLGLFRAVVCKLW